MEEGEEGGYQEGDEMEEKGSNELLPAAGRKLGGRMMSPVGDVGRKQRHRTISCSGA